MGISQYPWWSNVLFKTDIPNSSYDWTSIIRHAPKTYLVGVRAISCLVNDSYFSVHWRRQIQPLPTPKLWNVREQSILDVGMVPLVVQMEYLQVCTWLDVVEIFAVRLVLGTTITDRCIRGLSFNKENPDLPLTPSRNNLVEIPSRNDVNGYLKYCQKIQKTKQMTLVWPEQ